MDEPKYPGEITRTFGGVQAVRAETQAMIAAGLRPADFPSAAEMAELGFATWTHSGEWRLVFQCPANIQSVAICWYSLDHSAYLHQRGDIIELGALGKSQIHTVIEMLKKIWKTS